MKVSYYLLIILICSITLGCKRDHCKCNVHNNIILQNDTLIYQSKNWRIWELMNEIPQNDHNQITIRLSLLPSWHRQEKEIYTLSGSIDDFELTHHNFNYLDKDDQKRQGPKEKKVPITKDKSEKIIKLIEQNCFWSFTSVSEYSQNSLDGIIWILEVSQPKENHCTGRKYHLVIRKESELKNNNAFSNICTALIALYQADN